MLILFLPSNITHFCLQSEDFMVVAQLSTSTQKELHPRNMPERRRVPLTSYLATCRGRQVLAHFPHHMQNFSHYQYPPVMWNHDEKGEEGTSSVTGYKFFDTHLVYKKNGLHVKSWCIMKTCTLVKENLYWTNLISIFGNFRSPRNIAENSFIWVLKKNHRKQVSHWLQLLREFLRYVRFLNALSSLFILREFFFKDCSKWEVKVRIIIFCKAKWAVCFHCLVIVSSRYEIWMYS